MKYRLKCKVNLSEFNSAKICLLYLTSGHRTVAQTKQMQLDWDALISVYQAVLMDTSYSTYAIDLVRDKQV